MSEDLRYLLLACITAAAGLTVTPLVRRAFTRFRSREHKAGKELIYRHFPKHKKPLGGGVAIFATLAVGVGLAVLFRLPVPPSVWLWLLCGVAFGAIGFIDDWRKVNAARGLNEWVKLLLQIVLAWVFTALVVTLRHADAREAISVFLPFVGWVPLWQWLFLPFGIVVIVGASNAVNLTDGLDGLAGSGLAIAFAGYLVLSNLLQWDAVPPLIPLLVIASLVGFLLLNRPPARIIMGDTGALGLGAALGMLALLSRTEWLLLLFAAPFVIDTLSVIVQVTVIKFFRGPVRLLRHQTTEVFRPFLCTPLHHHFQWLTWGPWPILALFSGVGVLSALLAVLAFPASLPHGAVAFGWFWLMGMLVQAGFLTAAALQKVVRANFFLGLEHTEENDERMLALYKGLPVAVLGMRWYTVEEVTGISESMLDTIAAESILWRNISEIEARATLGKIYAEYKMFDRAAEEWEEIPLRNLLIRENLVVHLGKIYYGREELLRAVKLWEQLPPSRLRRIPGLLETIQSAKVRVGHLAGRLYHQAHEHAIVLRKQVENGHPRSHEAEVSGLLAELEAALRYMQDLRDLLAYEQQKAEGAGEFLELDGGPDLYRRMDVLLSSRREELHQALSWAQALGEPAGAVEEHSSLHELSQALHMTPAEIGRALEATNPLVVREFSRIERPSRNTLYRLRLEGRDARLPEHLVAKCFQETQVTFFSACYRRERGVLEILNEVGAPVPRLYGGHLGTRMAVVFMEDLGTHDFSSIMQALPVEDRAGRLDLLRRGLEALVMLRVCTQPVHARLDREIARIVKEVLTPDYYVNTTTIALNRILALDRRQLSPSERGRLEMALRPIIATLLEEPKTFIHFEFTPGNLQLIDNRVVAVDYEQSTMGPAAVDLATLLYAPEANLSDAEVQGLLEYYHELLPSTVPSSLAVRQEVLEAAAIMKMFFYAGSAANFYRKFEDGRRLAAMEWYLQTAERLLLRTPEYQDLTQTLRHCWTGQTHLQV